MRNVYVIGRVDGRLASKRRSCEFAAAVRDHLIHVHVELGATTGHPHMQRKHVVMPTFQDLVAGLSDQSAAITIESSPCVVCVCGGLLQNGVSGDHFTRDQIMPDTEMFQ